MDFARSVKAFSLLRVYILYIIRLFLSHFERSSWFFTHTKTGFLQAVLSHRTEFGVDFGN